jgi:hypothetical protein
VIERFADEQQSESKGLRKSRGEKRVKPLGIVARRLRMRVKHFAEFVADNLERSICRARRIEFGESIGDDASNEPRGVGQIACQLPRVVRRRWIGEGERRQRGDKPDWIAAPDQALRARVRRFRIERGLRHNFNRSYRIVPPEDA